MKFSRQGITTSVGYSFAFAALCSLAVAPGLAVADEVEGSSDSSTTGEPVVSDKTTNAPEATEKSETVYVFSNPDGSVKNTEVSTTLKNPDGASELADSSELTDIENTESDNTYTGSGSSIVWDAAGENVYYTGNTTKEAPVSIKVTYFLDGKKVSPDQLAGVSGKLKIRYDYDNNATVKATIKGKEETLYVPFTFVTAMLFDNENFKNAEVTNGKIIDDGDRVIIAGYAIPGLKKSLGSIVDDFDVPDYFEVTADVTNFEMKSSLTIATAGLFEDMDTDDFDTSKLEDASSELTSAMDQILDGADSLTSGLDKLAAGAKKADAASGKLTSGAKTLAKGAGQLSDGVKTMKEKAASLPEGVDTLATGASDLAKGLKLAENGVEQVDGGLDAVINGVKDEKGQVVRPGLSSLPASIETLQGYTTTIETMLKDIDTSVRNVLGETAIYTAAVKDAQEKLGASVSDVAAEIDSVAAEAEALGSGIDSLKGTVSDIETALASAKSGVEGAAASVGAIDTSGIEDKDVKAGIDDQLAGALGDIQTSGNEIDAAIETTSNLKSALDAVDYASLQSALSSLKEEVGALGTTAKDSLSAQGETEEAKYKATLEVIQSALEGTDGTNGLVGAAHGVNQGMSQAGTGIGTALTYLNQIKEGTAALNGTDNSIHTIAAGANQLSGGLSKLQEQVPTLIGGVNKLASAAEKLAGGANTLFNGVKTFGSGVSSLADGTKSAADGSDKLVDGLQQFNDEGIGKITDIIDDDLLPFTDRLDAISKAAKDYDNFAGITKGTKGSVKFIFETDPIETGDK